jgi:hypothetical protein
MKVRSLRVLFSEVVIVQVKVTGVNYVTPYFASSVYNVSVVEGQPQFTDLLSITANLDPNGMSQILTS